MKTKTDTKDRFVIIMAGGRGERFWPMSREKTPKQLIRLLGDRSFRNRRWTACSHSCRSKHSGHHHGCPAPEVRKQLPKLPKENVIGEPVGRDTCAAVTLGAALVGARSTTGVMAVLPADHVIPDVKKFQQVLTDAFDLASRGQAIVTIGIKPTEPATGYGYIRVGEALLPPTGESYKTVFHRGAVCRETKLRHGAGLFAERPVSLERGHVHLELRDGDGRSAKQPEIWRGPPALVQSGKQSGQARESAGEGVSRNQRISIDYASEKAHNVVAADGAFEWDDFARGLLGRH